MLTGSTGAILSVLTREAVGYSNLTKNSVYESLLRKTGLINPVTKILDANNTSVNVNLYKITGLIRVFNIWAKITKVTVLNDCTDAYFNFFDGTSEIEITRNGVSLSGLLAGSYIVRTEKSGFNAYVFDNSVGRLVESGNPATKAEPFFLLSKSEVDTFIRFAYSTTDIPINVEIEFKIEYCPVNGGKLEIV